MIKRYDFAMNCGDDNCLEQSEGGKYCLYKEVEKLEAERAELLDALKRALPHIQCDTYEQDGIITMCGNAIAKAEGEE